MQWHKITIPKPCREDWNTMSPNDKGKFCDVCSKTVVDFSTKSPIEISKYIERNKNKRICGYFHKKQLHSVNIEVPTKLLYKSLSFSKTFALALLLSMGTTLLSCKMDGKIKKIESVEVIDEHAIKKTESIDKDSVNLSNEDINFPKLHEIQVTGIIMLEEKDDLLGFIQVETSPQFKNSKNNSHKEFSRKISEFISTNFKYSSTKNLNLSKGKKRIATQFTINKKGNVVDIKVRAPHKELEIQIINILKNLPEFIPAKQNRKNVAIKYNLPINFMVE